MKKLRILALSMAVVACMCGCGGSSSSAAGDTKADAAAEAEETKAENEAAETEATEKEATTEKEAPAFEEQVIVDDENCTFTVKAIDAENLWGYTLEVYMENKTDKDLTFSLRNAAVNGWMCDPLWAESVTAGMKQNSEVSFGSEALKTIGITEVTDVEAGLIVYDSENWEDDYLVDQTWHIYPMGEDAAKVQEREAGADDVVLYDDENCTVIVTGYDPENLWGYTMKLYLYNKTDKNLTFAINDASVNGFMSDPYWATEVAAGKQAYNDVSWSDDELAKNNIEKVEELVLPFRVYDTDDWNADALVDEKFTVNP